MTPDERLLSSPVGYSYAKDANNYFNFSLNVNFEE